MYIVRHIIYLYKTANSYNIAKTLKLFSNIDIRNTANGIVSIRIDTVYVATTPTPYGPTLKEGPTFTVCRLTDLFTPSD